MFAIVRCLVLLLYLDYRDSSMSSLKRTAGYVSDITSPSSHHVDRGEVILQSIEYFFMD